MSASLYLEHYLESIENLPFEMQRVLTRIGELDEENETMENEIERMATQLEAQDAGTLTADERREQLKKIHDLYKKIEESADEKVTLASRTYEMVDRHIRRLDTDLERFQADLRDPDGAAESNSPVGEAAKKRRRKKQEGESASTPRKKKKKKDAGAVAMTSAATSLMSDGVDMAALDMPVDPNEPTYCLCHQVSYGEMIGCDNRECPIEWFHFQCVGLKEKPKGRWYCPQCAQERKKK